MLIRGVVGSPVRGVVGSGGGVNVRPANVVAAAIGDSLTAQSVTTTVGTYVQQDFRGALPWARALMEQRVYLPGGAIKGVGGERLDQILARISEVTATNVVGPDGVSVLPGLVFLNGGSNDIGQGATLQQVTSRLESCIAAIRAAGQVVALIGPTPQSSATTWTADQIAVLANFRDYVRARNRPDEGVYVADAWNDIASEPNGNVAAATMLRDTIHWHPKAAYLVGLRLAQALSPIFPTDRPLTEANLLTNPSLSGTSGSKSGGITGDVATSWSAATITLTGDQTIVASKVDLGGGEYAQQFSVSGTWASGSDIGISQNLSGWGTTYNPGDTMSMDGVIEIDGISPAPTNKFVPSIRILYKSGAVVSDALVNASEPTPAQTMSLNCRVERFTHPLDATRNTPNFNFSFPPGTHDFTVRFRAPRYVRNAAA